MMSISTVSILVLLSELVMISFAGSQDSDQQMPPVPEAPQASDSLEERLDLLGNKMGDYWLGRTRLFREDNPKQRPGGIVLVGASITERFPVEEHFPGMPVINRGIGGDRVRAIFPRLDLSVYDLQPSKVFILIGTNDVLYPESTEDELESQYTALIKAIQKNCPSSRIYLQSLQPLQGDLAQRNPQVRSLNQRIEKVAENQQVTFLDLYPLFVDENGDLKEEYSLDGVHLTPAAYQVYADYLRPFLEE